MFLPFCVKSSDLLLGLFSVLYTINTESVLNLRTTKTDMVREPLSAAPVPCTPCDEHCSFSTVQCTCMLLRQSVSVQLCAGTWFSAL